MLRCSKEAFARCPTNHLCGTREESTFAEGSECDKFNQAVAHRPMTNADRIRAMSDEELADFLAYIKRSCPPGRDNCHRYQFDCVGCRLEWLRQPADPAAEDKQHSGLG